MASPGASFIDMTDALCGDELCPAVRDGLIVYRDDNHLTGRYAAKMASILQLYLLGALGAAGVTRRYRIVRALMRGCEVRRTPPIGWRFE